MDNPQKISPKEALQTFFGELAIQLLFSVMCIGLGGIGLAYFLIGWGALWLLCPFVFLAYLLFKKMLSSTSKP